MLGATVPALIDTGFEGGLQLPEGWKDLIAAGVAAVGPFAFSFSDGRSLVRDQYPLPIRLAGLDITANTIFLGTGEALLGLEVLRHFLLTIDYPAGTVTLAPPSLP